MKLRKGLDPKKSYYQMEKDEQELDHTVITPNAPNAPNAQDDLTPIFESFQVQLDLLSEQLQQMQAQLSSQEEIQAQLDSLSSQGETFFKMKDSITELKIRMNNAEKALEALKKPKTTKKSSTTKAKPAARTRTAGDTTEK